MHFIKSEIYGSFMLDYMMLSNMLSNNGFLLHTGFDEAFFIKLFYFYNKKVYLKNRFLLDSQKQRFSRVR